MDTIIVKSIWISQFKDNYSNNITGNVMKSSYIDRTYRAKFTQWTVSCAQVYVYMYIACLGSSANDRRVHTSSGSHFPHIRLLLVGTLCYWHPTSTRKLLFGKIFSEHCMKISFENQHFHLGLVNNPSATLRTLKINILLKTGSQPEISVIAPKTIFRI